MNLGIIVDSSSGITLLEAKKRKWGFLPLIVTIDGTDYRDGVDFDYEKFSNIFRNAKTASTAATPLQTIKDEIDKFACKNDLVIIYPLSRELSSQKKNIELIAREFANVFVVDSIAVGQTIVRDLEELTEMIDAKKMDIEGAKNAISILASNIQGAIAVQTLEWLIKGGRISPALAKMVGALRVTPIISLKEGKLEREGVARGMRKALIKLTDEVMRHGGSDAEYIIYESPDAAIDPEYRKIIESKVGKKLVIRKLPTAITIHTGLGAISLTSRHVKAGDERHK